MKARACPPVEELRRLFDYSEGTYEKSGVELTGGLVWRPRVDKSGRPNTREVGTFAGTMHHKTHRVRVCIAGADYELHRLVWAWHNGDTDKLIDHKSRVVEDNRIGNLRPADVGSNNSNRTIATGTSKYVGVYLHRSGKYAAQIKKNGKSVYLGLYDSEVEAAKARDAATKRVHGEYGVLNIEN